MRLILHIGTEKTGTTSFQTFCDRHRAALLRQGVLYPEGLGGPHHRFVASYALSPETADDAITGMGLTGEQDMDRFRHRVEAHLHRQIHDNPGARICILSSEHLHSRLKTPDQIARVKSLLAPLFDEIEICLHLRPQVEMLVSLASTQSRVGGHVRRGFFARARAEDSYYNYDALARLWETEFGAARLRCIPFRESPDFLHWLAAQIGLDLTDLPPVPRINEALDIRVMAMVNALIDSGLRHRVDFRVLDRLPVKQKLTLDRKTAQDIQARFTPGNQALVARRPDLRPGQLQPDWARYPETGNLDILDAPCRFSVPLAHLVGQYNQMIHDLSEAR